MTRKPRTIAVVRLDDAEALADSIATAVGGRARALELLELAVQYLRTAP